MRASRTLFHIARVGLGAGHLVFKTAADLCMEAEVSIVKRTGFQDSNGDMRKFGDEPLFTEANYKRGREAKTEATQDKFKVSYAQALARVKAGMETKEKVTLTKAV